jgi:hypothetical protein
VFEIKPFKIGHPGISGTIQAIACFFKNKIWRDLPWILKSFGKGSRHRHDDPGGSAKVDDMIAEKILTDKLRAI